MPHNQLMAWMTCAKDAISECISRQKHVFNEQSPIQKNPVLFSFNI